jgi:hypothetical protein
MHFWRVKDSRVLYVLLEGDRSLRKSQVCYTCFSFSVFLFNHYHCLTHRKKIRCVVRPAVATFTKKRSSAQQELAKKWQFSAQICFYECEEHKITCNNSVLVLSSVSTPARSIFVILPNMAVICLMSSLILPHKQKVNKTRHCQCVYVCIYSLTEQQP